MRHHRSLPPPVPERPRAFVRDPGGGPAHARDPMAEWMAADLVARATGAPPFEDDEESRGLHPLDRLTVTSLLGGDTTTRR